MALEDLNRKAQNSNDSAYKSSMIKDVGAEISLPSYDPRINSTKLPLAEDYLLKARLPYHTSTQQDESLGSVSLKDAMKLFEANQFSKALKLVDNYAVSFKEQTLGSEPKYYGEGNTLDTWGPALDEAIASAKKMLEVTPKDELATTQQYVHSSLRKRVDELRSYAIEAHNANRKFSTDYVKEFHDQVEDLKLPKGAREAIKTTEFNKALEKVDLDAWKYITATKADEQAYYGAGNTLDTWGPAIDVAIASAEKMLTTIPKEERAATEQYFHSVLGVRVDELQAYAIEAHNADRNYSTKYVQKFRDHVEGLTLPEGAREVLESRGFNEALVELDRNSERFTAQTNADEPIYFGAGNTQDTWGPAIDVAIASAKEALLATPKEERGATEQYLHSVLGARVDELQAYAIEAHNADSRYSTEYVKEYQDKLEKIVQ